MKARDVTDGKLTWAIETNDVLKGLRKLPDNSVHCVVTSPPYWGLRDYGVEGQLGSEATPEEFVRKMVAVFRQVLGPSVTVERAEHILAGARRCAYRIGAKP